MTTASYIRRNTFVRYDGTNGAVVAAVMGRNILSDTGTVLTFTPAPPLFTDVFQLGDAFSPQVGFFLKADFEDQYLSALSVTPNPTGTMDGVSVAVPILLLGASVDRPVVWNTPFADASYKVRFLPDANTLGRITPVVKAGTKTANGLTVTISAGLALTVAGVLHVVGTT